MKSSILAFSALFATVLAVPYSTADVEKRGPPPTYSGPGNGRLFYCNSNNFYMTEGCREDTPALNTCNNFDSYFNDKISALASGQGIACTFYVDNNCQGSNFACSQYCELSWVNEFNDRLSSYICTKA